MPIKKIKQMLFNSNDGFITLLLLFIVIMRREFSKGFFALATGTSLVSISDTAYIKVA